MKTGLTSLFFFLTISFYVMSQSNMSTLTIEGNRIWVREYPKTGKVAFILNDGELCQVLKRGEEQVIRGNKDFWYKIEHEGKVGWVFGSQSSIKQKARIKNFEPFLQYFLETLFFGENLDSLVYFKSSIIKNFIHKEIDICRLYNPGTTCVPLDFSFNDSDYGVAYPLVEKPTFYSGQVIQKGFCEESSSPDGVYYRRIESMPTYPEFVGDNIKIKEIDIPLEYKDGLKVRVDVLFEHWIIKTMYFMVADAKWWLVVIDDCDCSA